MSTNIDDIEDDVQDDIQDEFGSSERRERITKQIYIATLMAMSKPDKQALRLNVQGWSEHNFWNKLIETIHKENPESTIDIVSINERKPQLLVARKNAFVQFAHTVAYYDVAGATSVLGQEIKATCQHNGKDCVRGFELEKLGLAYSIKNKKIWQQLAAYRVATYKDIPHTKKAGAGRTVQSLADGLALEQL